MGPLRCARTLAGLLTRARGDHLLRDVGRLSQSTLAVPRRKAQTVAGLYVGARPHGRAQSRARVRCRERTRCHLVSAGRISDHGEQSLATFDVYYGPEGDQRVSADGGPAKVASFHKRNSIDLVLTMPVHGPRKFVRRGQQPMRKDVRELAPACLFLPELLIVFDHDSARSSPCAMYLK